MPVYESHEGLSRLKVKTMPKTRLVSSKRGIVFGRVIRACLKSDNIQDVVHSDEISIFELTEDESKTNLT